MFAVHIADSIVVAMAVGLRWHEKKEGEKKRLEEMLKGTPSRTLGLKVPESLEAIGKYFNFGEVGEGGAPGKYAPVKRSRDLEIGKKAGSPEEKIHGLFIAFWSALDGIGEKGGASA